MCGLLEDAEFRGNGLLENILILYMYIVYICIYMCV